MLLHEIKNLRLQISNLNEEKQYIVTYKQNGHENTYKVKGLSVEDVTKQEKQKHQDRTILDVKLDSSVTDKDSFHKKIHARVFSDYQGNNTPEDMEKHAINKISKQVKEDTWDHVDDLEDYAKDKKTDPKVAAELKSAYDKHNKSKQTNTDDDELESSLKTILHKYDAHSDFAKWYHKDKNLDR